MYSNINIVTFERLMKLISLVHFQSFETFNSLQFLLI